MARTVVAPPSSVVKCLWEVFVWGFGVCMRIYIYVYGGKNTRGDRLQGALILHIDL